MDRSRCLARSILVLVTAPLVAGAQPTFTALGVIPGDASGSSEAFAVSADGSVVAGGGQGAFGSRAFRWTASGGIVDLQPNGSISEASGISADGSVVVGGNDDNYGPGTRRSAGRPPAAW